MNTLSEPERPPALSLFISRLDPSYVKHTGGANYTARCPAHDDHTPSLSVSWGNTNQVIFHCHAGCSQGAVLEAMRLTWSDIETKRRTTDHYDYVDEEDVVLYRVNRDEPKAFWQQRPDPAHPGKWLNNMQGVVPVPYRLADLAEALQCDEPVVIVEGEKDTQAVEIGWGMTATTNHGGAGKWTDEHSRHFVGSGSSVTIIADRDVPGYKHALKVRDSLLRIAGIEAQITLPLVGKDAADHVGDYGFSDLVNKSVDEIRDLAEADTAEVDEAHALAVAEHIEYLKVAQEARAIVAAEGWEPPPAFASLQTQLAAEREPVAWLIDELAFAGANVLINAVAKAGKTVLVLNVIRALLSGDPLFGHFAVRPLTEGTVVWWNAELTEAQALGWLSQMDFPAGDRFFPAHLRGYGAPITTPAGEEWAVRSLREQNCRVWVLDPKSALFTGEENSATETGAWLAALDRIKRLAGVETLFLVHHASDAANADEPDDNAIRLVRGRGSSRLEGWADVIWSYSGRFDEPRYLAAIGRDVDVPSFGGIHMTPETKALRWSGGTASPSQDRKHHRMVEAYDALVAAAAPLSASDLQDRMSGQKPAAKREAISYGVQQGYITQTAGPGNSKLHAPGANDPHTITLSFTSEESQ